jgi:hypothetical protein
METRKQLIIGSTSGMSAVQDLLLLFFLVKFIKIVNFESMREKSVHDMPKRVQK